MGRRFWKMSGSGNDFVVLDSRDRPEEPLECPRAIQALSARGTGVGADGVVFLARAERAGAALAMRYYNADGTRATFCGNATLCVARLARELGLAGEGTLALESDAGVIPTRLSGSGPEIELPPVSEIVEAVPRPRATGESRLGFAVAGVPHYVVVCDDVEVARVAERGAELRHDAWRPGGANVNFVSRRGTGWAIRTFERGVEGETLACGTGAVATAVLLAAWKLAGEVTDLATRSGRTLRISLSREGATWHPTLAGEGRLVFAGELLEWSDPPTSSHG